MPEIAYLCSTCKKPYEDKELAASCEGNHISPTGIIRHSHFHENRLPHDRKGNFPSQVTISFDIDGQEIYANYELKRFIER